MFKRYQNIKTKEIIEGKLAKNVEPEKSWGFRWTLSHKSPSTIREGFKTKGQFLKHYKILKQLEGVDE